MYDKKTKHCSQFPTILHRTISFFVFELHIFSYYFCRGFYHAPLEHTFIMNIYNWCQIHSRILHDEKQTRHFTNRGGVTSFTGGGGGVFKYFQFTQTIGFVWKSKFFFTIIIHPSWNFCYMLPLNNFQQVDGLLIYELF